MLNSQLVKNLYEEKNKLDKKYASLLGDVKYWMDASENRVLEAWSGTWRS
jgi:hypothetical protein